MGRVFLSYARDDLRRARKVAEALETAGHEVWWDSRLKGGSEYSHEIDEALKAADAVVVLWSKVSVHSEWVRDEAAVGKQSGRLVPATIDGTEPPLGFRQHHTINLSGRGQAGLGQLVDAVGGGTGSLVARKVPAKPRRLPKWWAAPAALLLLGAMVALLWVSGRLPLGQDTNAPVSLAVLPFTNASSAHDTGYFAEGVAEEIATQLAQQPQLRVAGRVSSLQLSRAGDPQETARKLGMHYLLEGTVRRAGEQVRIDVTLVKLSDGLRVWSQRFDGRLTDIFALQESVGRDVTSQLVSKFAASSGSVRRADPEAYALYLMARRLMREREQERVQTATELLQQALAIDPNYAPAWASLGTAQYFRADLPEVDVPAIRRQALASVDRALKLDPDLAQAHAAKGFILGFSTPEGARAIEHAAALNPNDAETQLWLGNVHGLRGDFQRQLSHYLKAIAVDPLWVRPLTAGPSLAFQLGDEAGAVRILRRFETGGDPATAYYLWGLLAQTKGDFSEAARRYRAALNKGAGPLREEVEQRLGAVLWDLGERDQARRINKLIDTNWSLLHGQLPAVAEVRERNRNYNLNLSDTYFVAVAVEAYLNAGRGAQLAEIYDSDGLAEQVEGALVLRQAGRGKDADFLLQQVESELANLDRDKIPHEYSIDEAAFWSVRGDQNRAFAALERAARGGWVRSPAYLPFGRAPSPDHCRAPAFAALRGKPRFERFCGLQRAHLDKERREYLAGR